MIIKTADHPNGLLSVKFSEEGHTYIDNNGVSYLSGTSLIKPFFTEFDSIKISERCSKNQNNPKYFGRDPEDIRAEWEKEATRGRTEGDNVHLYGEQSIQNLPRPKPISKRCKAIFKQIDIVVTWLLKKYILIGVEFIVFSPELLVAGMIDLLMYDPTTDSILVFDYKQNKEITTENNFQSGLDPIDHLSDTDINHYTLQLSLYEFILKTEGYFPEDMKYKKQLIHLSEVGHKVITLMDYEYEVKEILRQ